MWFGVSVRKNSESQLSSTDLLTLAKIITSLTQENCRPFSSSEAIRIQFFTLQVSSNAIVPIGLTLSRLVDVACNISTQCFSQLIKIHLFPIEWTSILIWLSVRHSKKYTREKFNFSISFYSISLSSRIILSAVNERR